MLKKRVLLQTIAWCAVFGFWFLISRDHHPTLFIDALVTLVLVLVSASCFYFNALVLQPQYARSGSWLLYVGLLITIILVMDLAAVLIIQAVYDHLWGPDPLRYGFWTNVLYETVFIVLHIIGAMIVVRFIRWKQSDPSNYAASQERS